MVTLSLLYVRYDTEWNISTIIYIYTEYFIVTLAINYLAEEVPGAFVNVKYVPGALV